MECIVAHVDHVKFDIEVALDEQYGALPLPFPGMDSKFETIYRNSIFKAYSSLRIDRSHVLTHKKECSHY